MEIFFKCVNKALKYLRSICIYSDLNNIFYPLTLNQVQANDDLPDKICLQCLKQIDQAFILKVQCEHADATLRKLCFEDHPADNVICLLSKDESIENPQEASDTSNAFESCDSISQVGQF